MKPKWQWKVFGYVYLIIVILVTLFPVYWLFVTSIKLQKDWLSRPPVLFPKQITFSNFQRLLASPEIQLALKNSFVVAASSTALAMLFGSLTAYVLTKIVLGNRRVNEFMLIGILITRLFPFITLLIPYFLMMRDFQLMDTLRALILINTSVFFPFVVWLMVGFFENIPREIEESAMIDGCNLWQRFLMIVIPITKTGLAVTSIFIFIASWNEFIYAITFTTHQAKTLPVVIGSFITDKGIQWGDMTALSVISITPVLLIAIFSQKYFVRGLTMGAVK
ncbi:carbohydrate ABC transporter permease [Fictibacillus sp. B-59209]|uniref:carbohydrate ABC transporter permease n=1 Tax=Fictibacillus sp. B-59209 TaxID=3024873 RepID=UPI002E1A0855|nr:carbohydrate ABC transporter permease [Fictibacillus sp. B-59209]